MTGRLTVAAVTALAHDAGLFLWVEERQNYKRNRSRYTLYVSSVTGSGRYIGSGQRLTTMVQLIQRFGSQVEEGQQ